MKRKAGELVNNLDYDALQEDARHSLLDSIDEGYCTIEVLFDARGTPQDYRFLETNPAFARLTGRHDAIGKTVSELVPQPEPFWLETYGRVALTGTAIRFEQLNAALGRHFDVYAFRIGAPEHRQVAVVFQDITDRKRREANALFLAEISQDLVQLTNASDTMNAVSARLGVHFDASLCDFVEVDEQETAAVRFEWKSAAAPRPSSVDHASQFHRDHVQHIAVTGETLIVRDAAQDARFDAGQMAALSIGSFISVPVIREGTWRFSVSLFNTAPHDWRDDEIGLLQKLTERIYTKLETARADEANKALFQRLLKVQEEERRRLARDIHDQLGQQMTALRMNIEALVGRTKHDADLAMQTERVKRLAEELDESVDFLTWDLRPAALAHLGLAAALEESIAAWSERFGIPSEFDAGDAESIRLPDDVEANVYRLVQEALHNVVKHAHATRIVASLHRRNGDLVFMLEDDGRGFNVTDTSRTVGEGGLGLMSMRERAAIIGGTLDIESASGRGTTIIVRIPVTAVD